MWAFLPIFFDQSRRAKDALEIGIVFYRQMDFASLKTWQVIKGDSNLIGDRCQDVVCHDVRAGSRPRRRVYGHVSGRCAVCAAAVFAPSDGDTVRVDFFGSGLVLALCVNFEAGVYPWVCQNARAHTVA